MTTKSHCLVDGLGRPLVIVVSPGQAGNTPGLTVLLEQLRALRLRGGAVADDMH